jgi:hypothetical protein
MMSKTHSRLIILHWLSFHAAPLGVANEPWHQKLFALTGDIVGNQMPQTIRVLLRGLDLLPHSVKVAKLAALSNNTVHTLGPVPIEADAALFDEVRM